MHRKDLDSLKGISIIAVVLFHMGLLNSGYLGVDAFFVINGFLVVPSVIRKINQAVYSYVGFIEKRIVRLLPLIVLASIAALVLGYFLMLPDHYENLAQSVIAGNLFSENILSAITTKNYWDVVNEYKPLMHLWYVGILFEFYIVFPLIMLLCNSITKLLKLDCNKWMTYTLALITISSLALYLYPTGAAGDKFYYLPYRFFEIGFGGLIASCASKLGGTRVQRVGTLLLILVIGCSLYNEITGCGIIEGVVIGKQQSASNGLPIPSNVALLLTVAFTCVVVACTNGGSIILKSRVLSWLGKMSYSIFIWHQVLLAFYRYSISYSMGIFAIVLFLLATITISFISYHLVEKKVKATKLSFAGWTLSAILVLIPSGYLYLHAGVVRDIPELDVIKGTEHRGMFGEYCDRVYNYKTFPIENNGKANVLVADISFGRDFANILLESKYKDSINLVYLYVWSDARAEELVKQSDYIFTFTAKDKLPAFVWESKNPDCKIMGISTKNYGSCNGIIYKNRNSADYFSQVATIAPGYKELNAEWKEQWGEDYIDLLTPSLVDNQHVRVFTDDKRYISQDCRHLTQAGAQWYAKILDWDRIFRTGILASMNKKGSDKKSYASNRTMFCQLTTD